MQKIIEPVKNTISIELKIDRFRNQDSVEGVMQHYLSFRVCNTRQANQIFDSM